METGCAAPEVTSHKTTQRVEENLEETVETMFSGLMVGGLCSGTKAESPFRVALEKGCHVRKAAKRYGDAASQKRYQRQSMEQINNLMLING